MTDRITGRKAACWMLGALVFLFPIHAFAQAPTPKEEKIDSPAVKKVPAVNPQEERFARMLDDFFRKYVSRDEKETIEQSEVSGILDDFERTFRILIPDRDVLSSSSLSSKDLRDQLFALLKANPPGVKPPPSLGTRIGGEPFAKLRAFQRRDLLNNPKKLIEIRNSPGQRSVSEKEIVAQAILSVRRDLADPTKASSFAKFTLPGAKMSDSDYVRLVRQFMENPTTEEFEALDLAIQRVTEDQTATTYSNGQAKIDSMGNEVYPNGKRRFDDAGNALYPNGRPMFDSAGNELHSNGVRMRGSDGVMLDARGRPKRTNNR